MEINKLYSNKITTKSGMEIPCFASGKTLESRYAPEREAEQLLQTVSESRFFFVFGLGSGIFVSKLSQKFPKAHIFCLENTKEDLDFLMQFPQNQNLNVEQITLSSISELYQKLIEKYIPALHGDIKFIERLPWQNENSQIIPYIKETINLALQQISADYSVQAHFGKIWQTNLLKNIHYIAQNKIKCEINTSKKTAAIIAAGPSLDSKINYLKEKQSELFIISTDTAFQVLQKNNIEPEIVVSLDAQFISHEHFLSNLENSSSKFFFDLCCNNTSLYNIKPSSIVFFNSGHPLSQFTSHFCDNSIPYLYSGAGTVTITAVDLAYLLGFGNLEVIGADFSYINGKTYANGTYLDSIYRRTESKLNSTETLFSKLMFRTKLEKVSDNISTTKVLQSYQKSFEEYLISKNSSYTKENDVYYIKNPSSKSSIFYKTQFSLNQKDYFSKALELIKKGETTILLPYISYLRTKHPQSNFDELLNLAYSDFVSYNNFI